MRILWEGKNLPSLCFLSIKILCHPFYVIAEIYDGGHFFLTRKLDDILKRRERGLLSWSRTFMAFISFSRGYGRWTWLFKSRLIIVIIIRKHQKFSCPSEWQTFFWGHGMERKKFVCWGKQTCFFKKLMEWNKINANIISEKDTFSYLSFEC